MGLAAVVIKMQKKNRIVLAGIVLWKLTAKYLRSGHASLMSPYTSIDISVCLSC